MDRLKQIEAFASVAIRGSLSAAARAEGVTPAIIGRRIDALEARLGARLLLRTTRKLTLTFEGQAFLEDCQRLLNDLANAEAAVSLGGLVGGHFAGGDAFRQMGGHQSLIAGQQAGVTG